MPVSKTALQIAKEIKKEAENKRKFCCILLKKVPRSVRRCFKAACARREVGMVKQIIELMKTYCLQDAHLDDNDTRRANRPSSAVSDRG